MAKQKVVVRLLSLDNAKNRTKALKSAVSLNGVTSVSVDRDRLTVVCDGTDVVALTMLLRKRLGYADLVSVTSGDQEKLKEGKEGKETKLSGTSKSVVPYEYGYPYPYSYHSYGSKFSSVM
ncbi:hypothetical protein LUZ60_008686 [Juncus effusus]|nr:hypothetical protein LUZ60_008686 [Juncus effusus]